MNKNYSKNPLSKWVWVRNLYEFIETKALVKHTPTHPHTHTHTHTRMRASFSLASLLVVQKILLK